MPVKEADPRAQELDAAFADAMNAPAKPKEAPAPPEVDREAPHGRDEQGNPIAKYGHNKDGSIRRSPAGRPRKDEQPRTVAAQPEAPAAPGRPSAAALEPRDFSAALMDAGETIWFGGSIAAKVGPQIPVLGRFIPGRKLAATMAVFDSQRPALASALNLAAQHDARARKLAARLADGDAGWALTCMFLVAPFTGAVAAVWQTTDKRNVLAERELPGLDELAQRNEDALDRMFTRITAQMEQAQQMQQAAMAAQMQQAMEAQANGQVTVSG